MYAETRRDLNKALQCIERNRHFVKLIIGSFDKNQIMANIRANF